MMNNQQIKSKYKLKPLNEIDMTEMVSIDKRLLYYALYTIQDYHLLKERHNHCVLSDDFTQEEINNFIHKLNDGAISGGYYEIMELLNGEKFND